MLTRRRRPSSSYRQSQRQTQPRDRCIHTSRSPHLSVHLAGGLEGLVERLVHERRPQMRRRVVRRQHLRCSHTPPIIRPKPPPAFLSYTATHRAPACRTWRTPAAAAPRPSSSAVLATRRQPASWPEKRHESRETTYRSPTRAWRARAQPRTPRRTRHPRRAIAEPPSLAAPPPSSTVNQQVHTPHRNARMSIIWLPGSQMFVSVRNTTGSKLIWATWESKWRGERTLRRGLLIQQAQERAERKRRKPALASLHGPPLSLGLGASCIDTSGCEGGEMALALGDGRPAVGEAAAPQTPPGSSSGLSTRSRSSTSRMGVVSGPLSALEQSGTCY